MGVSFGSVARCDSASGAAELIWDSGVRRTIAQQFKDRLL